MEYATGRTANEAVALIKTVCTAIGALLLGFAAVAAAMLLFGL